MPRKVEDPRPKDKRTLSTEDGGSGKTGRKPKKTTKYPRKKDSYKTALVKTDSKVGRHLAPLKNWKWSRSKRKFLDLVLKGSKLTDSSALLKKHPATLRRWLRTPEFLMEANSRLEEGKSLQRNHRLAITTDMVDRIEEMVLRALNADDESPEKKKMFRLLQEYRAMRSEERKDFGDNVKKVENTLSIGGQVLHAHAHKHQHEGEVKVSSLHDVLKRVVIPGDYIEGETVEEVSAKLATKVMLESDVLEEIHKKDDIELAEENNR